MFVTTGTVVTAFAVMEEGFFTHERKVFNNRRPVIMDLIRQSPTGRAGECSSLEREGEMDFGVSRGNIV